MPVGGEGIQPRRQPGLQLHGRDGRRIRHRRHRDGFRRRHCRKRLGRGHRRHRGWSRRRRRGRRDYDRVFRDGTRHVPPEDFRRGQRDAARHGRLHHHPTGVFANNPACDAIPVAQDQDDVPGLRAERQSAHAQTDRPGFPEATASSACGERLHPAGWAPL